MTDETRTRFLAAIARQLSPERVIEVHLFSGIRQGGVESGVAVIALEREQALSLDVDGGFVPEGDMAEAAEVETAEAVSVHDQLEDETAFVADETIAPLVDAEEASPYREVVPIERDLRPTPPASRYTIYSARYRHTLKGMDRGKWEVSVTEEADAPLLTVDAVVRGVQRRSGDAEETVRLSGEEFRGALPTPVTA